MYCSFNILRLHSPTSNSIRAARECAAHPAIIPRRLFEPRRRATINSFSLPLSTSFFFSSFLNFLLFLSLSLVVFSLILLAVVDWRVERNEIKWFVDEWRQLLGCKSIYNTYIERKEMSGTTLWAQFVYNISFIHIYYAHTNVYMYTACVCVCCLYFICWKDLKQKKKYLYALSFPLTYTYTSHRHIHLLYNTIH